MKFDLKTWTPASAIVLLGFLTLMICVVWYVVHGVELPQWLLVLVPALMGGGAYGIAISHANGNGKGTTP